MRPTITAFAASPDRGRGLARDMRVRWALEEVGQVYDVRLLTFAEMKEAPHLAMNPFGQIPTYEDDGLRLFETGAIILHIAERHDGLLPQESDARARAKAWMFAAVSSVEPWILELENTGFFERDKPWFQERMAAVEARLCRRLEALARWLDDREWLDGAFSAGDLMMVSVLQRIRGAELFGGFPGLAAYVARAEARPAYARAFAAQLAVYHASLG
jgi:glutathione S-transferase